MALALPARQAWRQMTARSMKDAVDKGTRAAPSRAASLKSHPAGAANLESPPAEPGSAGVPPAAAMEQTRRRDAGAPGRAVQGFKAQSLASEDSLPGRIRILAVDDQPMVLKGLRMLLGQEPDMQVCGDSAGVSSAKQGIARLQPHLVVVDLGLEDGDGFELMEWLNRNHPGIKMLVFTSHDDLVSTARASRCGAQGYVVKDDGTQELIRAIRVVMRDQHYASSQAAHPGSSSRRPGRKF